MGKLALANPGAEDLVDESDEIVCVGWDAGESGRWVGWWLEVVTALVAVWGIWKCRWVSDGDDDGVWLVEFHRSAATDAFSGAQAIRIPVEDEPGNSMLATWTSVDRGGSGGGVMLKCRPTKFDGN